MFDCLSNNRDPARVARVLDLLRDLWRKYPQLRLGQLLVNVHPGFENRAFFLEDDELEAALKKALETHFGA